MTDIAAGVWRFDTTMKQLLDWVPIKESRFLTESPRSGSSQTCAADYSKQIAGLQTDLLPGVWPTCDDELVELYRVIDLAG